MSAGDKHTLSYQLRDLVDSRGLSGHALGELANTDPRAMTRWLKGEKDINLETADKIAAALGVRLVEVAARRRRG